MEMEVSMSPSVGKIAEAMAKAQADIKPAPKDKQNPFFKSHYADLSSVWSVIRGPLTANGISVIQAPQPTDGKNVSVKTLLLHASGEWISGTLTMVPKDVSPQGLGSCLTYARRYALSAMTGVCSEEDDDGNQAEGKDRQKAGEFYNKPAATPPKPAAPSAKPQPKAEVATRRLVADDWRAAAESIGKAAKEAGLNFPDFALEGQRMIREVHAKKPIKTVDELEAVRVQLIEALPKPSVMDTTVDPTQNIPF